MRFASTKSRLSSRPGRIRAHRRRFASLALAGAAMAVASAQVRAQIATLDKGHSLLINDGLQIWGLNTDSFNYNFSYSNFAAANLTAVAWSFGQSNPGALTTGQKWAKWVDYTGSPSTALNSTENAHYADLLAIQVGDEQEGDMESPSSVTTTWFQNAHSGNYFNDKLLYTNSNFIANDGAFITFVANANPDAISFDSYPFGSTGLSPNNWLGKAQQYRRHALGSYIGATGNAPRPYGLYLQTYHAGDGARDPGDVEMRWQQFTAWTMGYTFADCFTAGGGNTSLFNSGNGFSPHQPTYDQFKESARQSRNLGPALTHLISYSNGAAGGGTSIVRGQDAAGNITPVPTSWQPFSLNDAPPNQRYLSSISAVNLGSKNGGHPGDVYVGFFNPLQISDGDPAGEAYFMITNGLGGSLQDGSATVADCAQELTLNFNFGSSGINSLQRLRRSDGQVEVVPLQYVSGSQYKLVFNLDGGTGDLFKYNDGTPFVGIESGTLPGPTVYWDNDASAANNNSTTGAGLGGSGTWDTASSKWYNGASNAPWAANSNAVFWGTAGAVTVSAPQTVNSLAFKTNGYSLSGSTITLAKPTVTVDSGVIASIGSALAGSAGLVKNGAGTLNLSGTNTYTGGTTINAGVVSIVSSVSLGANPSTPGLNLTLNNGGTLRFDGFNITLNSNRQIRLGATGGGGVIDTNGNLDTIAGAISGSSLTKIGGGTLVLSGTNSFTAGTSVTGGTLRVSSDANLGAAPATLTTNITLDGGTLQFGGNFDIANTRGINIGAAGGTIDTQGFTNPSGYNPNKGFSGGDLTKIGAGTFFASATTAGINNVWKGSLILKQGTWKVVATDGLPYNPPLADGLQPAQITLDGGTWQAAASINSTNARRGVTIAAGGGTIDTMSNNLTWAGPWAGNVASAVLTKIGSGTLQLNSAAVAPGSYAGNLSIADGTVRLVGGTAMGDLAAISLANVSSAALDVTGNETIGSLAGGGAAGGNVTLGAITLTTGGNGNSTTYAGIVSGAGANLIKTGGGTMTLAGANTYSGATTVSAGKLVLASSSTTSSALNVQAGASVELAQGGGNTLVTPSLAIAGSTDAWTARLDVKDNDVVIHSDNASRVARAAEMTNQLKQGANFADAGHFWTGNGIVSSMSGNGSTSYTAVGVAVNDFALLGGSQTGAIYSTFDGQDVGVNDVLVKYTYFGDADLDGAVTTNDYFQIDNGFLGSKTGWINGDFDYDGAVTTNDYFLIDNAFLGQGSALVPASLDNAKALSGVSAVPEPTSLAVFAFAASLLGRRRRS
jgi:autotransporter-associated beta strand protein